MTSSRSLGIVLLLVVSSLAIVPQMARAETYASGQSVFPAYEGWERNEDGSFNLVFGYMNENWQEELNVPVGPENNFQPGGPDQGQPTRFLPRRNRFIFRVRVPKDFGNKELVWTLTTRGRTEKAFGSLRPDLILENVDIMSETGALGAGTSNPEVRANKAPMMSVQGAKNRDAKVGEVISLEGVVTDDGVPKARESARFREAVRAASVRPPVRPTVAKGIGLHLSWFVYRGAGTVSFEPSQIKVWEDTRTGANSPWAPYWIAPPVPEGGKYVVKVTFSEPGTYILCGRADDGGLTTDQFVTFNVTR